MQGNTVTALREVDKPQDGLIAFRTANDGSVSADMRVDPAADKWNQTRLIRTISTYFHWLLIHRQAAVVMDWTIVAPRKYFKIYNPMRENLTQEIQQLCCATYKKARGFQ